VLASTCLAIHYIKKRLPVEDYLEILSLAPDTILPTNANGEANPADAITKGKP
jgi:hypothetical protein